MTSPKPTHKRARKVVPKDDYADFIDGKTQHGTDTGFDPLWLPSEMFDFQSLLTTWALRKGRAALYEDTGLGKTYQQLVWAENVVRKTNKPVLVLTPLAVSHQTVSEAEKFGIQCVRDEVRALARVLGVRRAWLAFGEGARE